VGSFSYAVPGPTTGREIPQQRSSDDPAQTDQTRRPLRVVDADPRSGAPAGPDDEAKLVAGAARLDLVRAALTAGARGYLFPGTARGAAAEPAARSYPAVASVLSSKGERTQLTGREVEILQLVANGRTNREIADELGLSAFTVKSHLSRIGHRLQSGDRAQLVLLALRSGAIS
jgi:DNA-binding NarL/FixJ family response regulator